MSTADQQESDNVETLAADVFARDCLSRPVLQSVMSRWGTLALVALLDEPHRFAALRRRVDGVSERMLSQTLHQLERDGFVHRDVQATIPPKVEYSLTARGEEVAGHMRAIAETIENQIAEIRSDQKKYDSTR
ncbi:winged helix-turn-helix transcriptional regulator [Rhodococcus gannanensis]|uniref:Winged helix-turn-helix transcriptional regulator n=1 Tax=Rhodococcus gannanensis TaxID=1960308 RepID=A0ABW4P9E2_9NOCA